MTLKVGRLSLSAPRSIPFDRHGAEFAGVAGPLYEKGFMFRGFEQGSLAQGLMDSLEKESLRKGDLYITDTDGNIPSGYYHLEDAGYDKPGGMPMGRHWSLSVLRRDRPYIIRQAEDDNVDGTDTQDTGAEEAVKVVYTATAGEVDVLKPRDVAGGEAFNLPSGDYRFIARVQSRTTVSQKFRVKTTALDGTVLTTGTQVTAPVADAWVDLDLGTFNIPDANHESNWYKLTVQANADLNPVWLDRLRVVPL